MKKILITGANSYIGTSFEDYMKQFDGYLVDTVDMIDGSWRDMSFTDYDVIFHVAGIAHSDFGKISEERKAIYYSVNTDLAIETANKAKTEGVKQFVFMSSASVYGESASIGKHKIITKDTPMSPSNYYGDSKVRAENGLSMLADENFKIAVLRPPMIYGENCKGNYPTLSKFAKKLPVFPHVKNERSMLYIGNLVDFIKLIIDNDEEGVFFPQNSEYSNTSELVKMISNTYGKKLLLVKGFTWVLKIMSKFTGLVNKAFGNLTYDMKLSEYKCDYRKFTLEDSIRITEGLAVNHKPRAMMLASVASMIDIFNTDNVNILSDLGYQVDVAANFDFGSITSKERVEEYKQELNAKGIKVYNVPMPRNIFSIGNIIKSYTMVKKIVTLNRYDVVHCHSPIGGVICRLACKKARKQGTKVIYTAHGFHFFKGASKVAWAIYYPIERICSHFTDVLITINGEDYERANKFKAKKVEYVPGIGVHTEEFRNVKVSRDALRKEFEFSNDDFVFMSVGQLSVRKNHEVAIKALSKINNPKVKYLIVGFGELEEYLKSLVTELRLDERVVFAGYRGDIKELLHAVDAFVFPSLQEGLPVALMEAMSVGLPVVCSRIRGNTDLVENGKGGYMFDCNDIYGFAKGMEKIVEGDVYSMGQINVDTMKNFDIERVNSEMLRIYSQISK